MRPYKPQKKDSLIDLGQNRRNKMIELNVRDSWDGEVKTLGINGEQEERITFHYLTKLKAIDIAQKLIKAAMELLPDECKGEIELLQAVHSKLESKEIK